MRLGHFASALHGKPAARGFMFTLFSNVVCMLVHPSITCWKACVHTLFGTVHDPQPLSVPCTLSTTAVTCQGRQAAHAGIAVMTVSQFSGVHPASEQWKAWKVCLPSWSQAVRRQAVRQGTWQCSSTIDTSRCLSCPELP
jgi:hypothetical protein